MQDGMHNTIKGRATMPRARGPGYKGGRNRYVKEKRYSGVYHVMSPASTPGKQEKVYYISYYQHGKRIFEKVGRHGEVMEIPGEEPIRISASTANAIRADRERGKKPSNKDRRDQDAAKVKAEAGRWTFDKLWTQWKTVNATKKGIVNDDNRYKTHLQGPFGNKEPKDIVPLDVTRLESKLLKDPARRPGRKFDPDAKRRSDYAQATIQVLAEKSAAKAGKGRPYAIGTVVSILSLFRRIASFGVKKQLCQGLSFTVEIPTGAKQKTENMTDEQLTAYIKACREWPNPQAGNFQLLQIYTGLRRGEVRKLRWDDIDLQTGFITLRDPKGGEDTRVPLSSEAKEMLEAHPKSSSSTYVFVGEKGGQRGIHQIENTSRAIRDAAGLPADFRPNHGLRHTYASHLANSGEVDLYLLQRLLTHKDPKTTQRYAHLRDEVLKRGADVMGRIVKDAETA